MELSHTTTDCAHSEYHMVHLLFASWVILHAFCRLLIFFQNHFFLKILSGIPSECPPNWIQIRPDILSDLIWDQSVCKCYEQTTLVGKELTGLTAKSFKKSLPNCVLNKWMTNSTHIEHLWFKETLYAYCTHKGISMIYGWPNSEL